MIQKGTYGSSFRLRCYPFPEGQIDPERPPKAGGPACYIGPPRGGQESTILGGALRAFRMATGVATSRAKTSTTIGRNAVSVCYIGCFIRSSVM